MTIYPYFILLGEVGAQPTGFDSSMFKKSEDTKSCSPSVSSAMNAPSSSASRAEDSSCPMTKLHKAKRKKEKKRKHKHKHRHKHDRHDRQERPNDQNVEMTNPLNYKEPRDKLYTSSGLASSASSPLSPTLSSPRPEQI